MDGFRPGQLVTVSNGGPDVDGIVFVVPSPVKIIVAMVDPRRGPGLRTVHPRALAAREQAGGDDAALQSLIRRTSAAAGAAERGQTKGSVQQRRGHARSATHRTTGK